MSGTPSDTRFVGTGNPDKTSKGWCLESATFRIVIGSAWGSADLLLNGKAIASFSCSNPPTTCGDDTQTIDPIKLAKPGAVFSWRPTSCIDSTGAPCTGSDQFMVTIEFGFEPAKTQ